MGREKQGLVTMPLEVGNEESSRDGKSKQGDCFLRDKAAGVCFLRKKRSKSRLARLNKTEQSSAKVSRGEMQLRDGTANKAC